MTESTDTPNKDADALPPELQAEADAFALEGDALPPADAVPASEPPPSETADMMAALLGVTFNGLIAPARGTHWQMSEAECSTLGGAYAAVLDKYFPDLSMGVEVTALLATAMIVGPRIAQDMELRATAADDNGDQKPGEKDDDA